MTNYKNLPDFDDLIFENRNKAYGAYQLRKNYKSNVIFGLIIAISIACFTIISSYLIEISSDKVVFDGNRYLQSTMDVLEPPEEELYIPPATSPPELRKMQENIKYIAPEVVDSSILNKNALVTNDEILTLNDDTLQKSGVTGTGDDIFLADFGTGSDNSYIHVEVMPAFMGGGISKFQEWVRKRTIYPQEAIDNKISGTVFLTFIVEKDGSVNDVTLLRGVHPILDNEALKVISESPKWSPGRQRGQPVRIRYIIPINFSPMK